ncbi:2-(3-amino-3-carboxypropyl)histidine synthase subunit 1 [Mercurialis annua]|uniref:2-(3-amino-3-carboxypropyl)histidine synthase subunit 1 n=1 Tax=Mercurialis annua TaxID=3986 RepID=UPI002160C2E7|nr:2-(3-amino-3-carboxypropyl)histidine synthase subunit 1 [Mercurialis annua]
MVYSISKLYCNSTEQQTNQYSKLINFAFCLVMESIDQNIQALQLSTKPKPAPPKRFIKNQIPDSILNDPSLNAAIALLPKNYNLEIHKCVHRIRSANAKRLALQLPEGLLLYSLVLSDIFTAFAGVTHCFILGDVTYGACCVDDFSALALGCDLLIHYGHSCLVPIDNTKIPCLYVFVEIRIDVECLVSTVEINLMDYRRVVLAGTIQFASAIREAKPELERLGLSVLVPQSKPLSAGEVLGCTAPRIGGDFDETVAVFVADGRFHLEAFMIANPGIRTFRYDPYLGKLFLEEYDHRGMKDVRKGAIETAKDAKNWGVILGTLGRQGNPRILDRLEKKMVEKGLSYTVFLMSEISPVRIALFEDCVDAWIQVACPRLSIDWGAAFKKPLLTPFEAEIALGDLPGWWEKTPACGHCDKSCSACSNGGEYPMDYYSQDGGEWNSSYVKKTNRPLRRTVVSSAGEAAAS